MRSVVALFALALCATLLTGPAQAQDNYPSRVVRLVVPLAPGGPTDFMARTVAQELSTALGQKVLVDNKPGADGALAAREVIAAAADGYTLLFATGSMIALPLQKKPPAFDWLSELAPVGKVGRVSFCVAVNSGVPATSIAELVAYARSHPDEMAFSTSTLSELMAAAQFMKAAGIRMTRVPYKGGAQAMPDLLAGRIQVMFAPVTLIQSHVKGGSIRVLATLLGQRSSVLPNVPTLAEAGYPGVSVPTWQAIFAPAKTPKAIMARLAGELATVIAKPDVRAEFERRAIFVEGASPQELDATITQEQSAWNTLIAEYKIGTE